MAGATLTPLPPAEAIAALVRRGQRLDPTFSWQDAWEADHAAMFTVAKSAGFDILKDIHAALVAAIAEGTTFEDFAKTLKPTLQAKGWWGRQEVTDPATGEIQERVLGSTRRLATIFNTNMRVSYATGHWAQFERNRVARPVLRYVSLLYGKDRRKAHIAQHNVTLPVDDPHWDRWAPPCGWGCQCTLQSLSLRDVERMRAELKFTPPAETMRAYVNNRTGVVSQVPDGIDPGWAYNPGKAGWRAATMADKLIDAPPELAAAARADASWPVERVADEFQAWFRSVRDGRPVQEDARTVGALDAEAIEALAGAGTPPASAGIVVDAVSVRELAALQGPAAALVERLPETIARAALSGVTPGRARLVADVPGEPGRRIAVEVTTEPARESEPRRPARVGAVRLIDEPAEAIVARDVTRADAIPAPGTRERAFHDAMLRATNVFGSEAEMQMVYEGGKPQILDITPGGRTGVVQRVFDLPEGENAIRTVEHSLFVLDQENRGGGQAKAFLARSIEAYRHLDVDRVTMHANIDVGGYAWLKYGFEPDAASGEYLAAYAMENADQMKAAGAIDDAAYGHVARMLRLRDFQAAADFQASVPIEYGGKRQALGKHLFIGSDWHGTLDMRSRTAMARFRAYVGDGR